MLKLSNKKLLIINLPPPFGGGEILNLLLSEHFSQYKEYVILNIGKSKQKKNQQGKLSYKNGIHGLWSIFSVIYNILKYRPSVVYFLIPKTFLAFLKSIPIILLSDLMGIHSIGSLEGNSFYFLSNNNKFSCQLGSFFLRKIKVIRVLGNSIAKELAKHKINNTIVVSNGVEVPSYVIKKKKIQDSNTSIKFLYVGVLSESKGILFLIQSFIKLLKITENVELHLIGEWYSKELQKQIEDEIETANLNKYFFFHGLQHTTGKWQLFSQMNIYIHLTKLDGQPLSILEAMGCGLPVISTKVGAIPETVIDNYNGFLLNEYTSAELIRIMMNYIDNAFLLTEHAANSISLFNKLYTSSRFLQRMENLFNQKIYESINTKHKEELLNN